MIIGNGDIAKILPEKDYILYFASGVSNSQETREEEYQREKDLLQQYSNYSYLHCRLVYFSSLAVFYKDSRYVRHKKEMEQLIKKVFPHWTIVRIGNITWGTNPHTIINFFRNKIARGEPIDIRDEYRYVVDKDEFLHWVNLIPDWNCEMNIPGERLKIKEIVDKYGHLGLPS